MDAVDSQVTFVVVTFSAGLPGIVMGSVLADMLGGYKGVHKSNAMTLLCVFAFLSTIFSVALAKCYDPAVFIYLLWFFLLFGAAVMPIASGITVSCVPKYA